MPRQWMRVQLAFCAALLIGRCGLGQEAEKTIGVDEIVARHEATWKKLEKLAIKGEVKSRSWAVSAVVDEHGKRHVGKGFIDREQDVEFWRDECKLGCRLTLRALDNERRRDEVVLRDQDMVTYCAGKHVEKFLPEKSPPPDMHAFGRTLERAGHAHTTLADWIADQKPRVVFSQNSHDEKLAIFQAKFQTSYNDGQAHDESDDLEVTVNLSRGALIERIEFRCGEKSQAIRTTWSVSIWRDLGNGVYFPENFAFEWEDRDKDRGLTWRRFHLTDIELDPTALEERFAFAPPPGAVVIDHTGRTDVAAVCILDDDGSPKRTFSTIEAYRAYCDQLSTQEAERAVEARVALLFPGHQVKATYDKVREDYTMLVTTPEGDVIQEFQHEWEVDMFEFIRETLLFVLRSTAVNGT